MGLLMTSRVWQTSKQTGGNLLLLMAIADFADDDGYAFPAVKTLAKKARMTDRHVRRVLRSLQDAGELQCEENAGPKGCNLYRVVSPPPDKMSAPDPGVREPLTPASGTPDVEVSQTVREQPREQPKEQPTGEKDEDALTLEAGRFVEWFLELLRKTGAPEPKMTATVRAGWDDAYEKLVRIDGKTKGEIARVCEWARGDPFWRTNFYAPTKLRERKDGISRYDLFLSKLNSPTNGHTPPPRLSSRYFESAGSYAGITDK